ncbi:Platelet-activating factor acetylhydrolase plasma/intracellular isoform II [Alishewanella agri BL06]|uniref:Platelet-activating factor acetylhydrolase plasma/intracellular isoform II n=1 Tax=Alishewanella agri BL06 TaxID=1195246 RepID=I9NZ78_9ALTE|nr:alpha/beta fold hydrolase [Alishewanella agri]EIW87749.1 Platelet-activating factor acetylhydrolase plasma/intracellular isoform II [Alishewanella agri BL06]
MQAVSLFKAASVAAIAFTLLLALAGCAKKPPVPDDSVWQQQLSLPSVQASVDVVKQLSQQVEVVNFDWWDQSRERIVPALLFKPATQQPAKALIIFSHGLGGSKERYSYLGQYWASQGYASLHLQHDGSDRKVWRGSRLTLPFRLKDAAAASEALARVQDVKFALDQLLASEYALAFDAQQIVMAGHSYGANTSMLLSGAQVEQDGVLVSLRDERIKAAILISAPPFYNDQPLDSILAEVRIPTLHITTTEDEIRVPGFYSSPQDRFDLFNAMASNYKVLAVFSAGSHNIFSGWRRNSDSTAQQQVIKAATQALSSAFIERLITGDDRAIRLWAQQHQAVLADFVHSDLVAKRDEHRTAPLQNLR